MFNRKGLALKELIVWIIVIIVIVVVILIALSSREDVLDSFNSIINGVNVFFGAEKVQAKVPELTPEQEKGVNNLIKGISYLKEGYGKYSCLYNYNSLPLLKDMKIALVSDGENTNLNVFFGENLQQTSTKAVKVFNDLQLCVIAGKDASGESIPANFIKELESWDYSKKYGLNSESSFYGSEIRSVEITAGEEGVNIIRWVTKDGRAEEANLEDHGWLFKSPGGDICFFPTPEGPIDNIGDSDPEEGINSDFIKQRLATGKFLECKEIKVY
jgi:hypothetical protein